MALEPDPPVPPQPGKMKAPLWEGVAEKRGLLLLSAPSQGLWRFPRKGKPQVVLITFSFMSQRSNYR